MNSVLSKQSLSPDFANSSSQNYNWIGVLEFLQEQYRSSNNKETEWLIEKQQFQSTINRLEGELQAHENINKDLLKRIKMLEFALRQERIKNLKKEGGQSVQESINHFFSDNNEANSILQNLINNNEEGKGIGGNKVVKPYRPLLAKFLEEIGFDDIFASNEIKESNNKSMIQKKDENNNSVTENSAYLKGKSNSVTDSNLKRNFFLFGSQSINSKEKTEEKKILESSAKEKMAKISKTYEEKTRRDEEVINPCNFKCSLKNHLDGVRDIFFTHQDDILVSVSEDCMIKLWDCKSMDAYLEQNLSVDPYLTLRDHTGPLFTITGEYNEEGDLGQSLLYTAGSEGIIKCWSLPIPSDSENLENNQFCLASWNAHEDAIWDIEHHPLESLILSSGSDGTIKLWRIIKKDGDISTTLATKYNCSYSSLSDNSTSLSWVYTSLNKFVSGFINNPNITIYDKDNGKAVTNFLFKPEERDFQTNKIVCHKNINLFASGHEDKAIRFWDMNTNKLIKSVNAHGDGVTSLAFSNTEGFSMGSVSHDGSLKLWDIRNYECFYELKECHYNKFDESSHCLALHPYKNYLATGGADGVIKFFNVFR